MLNLIFNKNVMGNDKFKLKIKLNLNEILLYYTHITYLYTRKSKIIMLTQTIDIFLLVFHVSYLYY